MITFSINPTADSKAVQTEISIARLLLDQLEGHLSLRETGQHGVSDYTDMLAWAYAIIQGTTDNVRAFLRELAQHPNEWFTANELSNKLGHGGNERSIGGITAGLTRKQDQLIRNRQLVHRIKLYEDRFDGQRMSYSMTEQQAQLILDILDSKTP